MTNTPSAEKHPSQPEPPRLDFKPTTIGNLDAITGSSTTDPGQVLRDEEASGCRDQLRKSSSSGSLSKNEDMIITSIRATDVTLGLRRLPAGFYVLLHHEGLQWRTEIKPASVDADVVEWSTLTGISSSMLATICLEVYASFEFHPVLGSGERLRKITFEVKQLWEHSERDFTFSFLPEDGDVVSPCSSILVTIKRQRRQSDGPSVFGALGSPWSTPESQDEIAEATDSGHCALTRYRKHGRKHDLECAISQFEHAVDICPPDHPCRAAVQSNLATAKLILCQVEDTDAFLKEALRLYCDALAARPASHPDRPSTLIHLAVAHFMQFQKKGNLVERTMVDGLLDQALELIPAQSHQNQAVIFLRQLHATRMIPSKPTVESAMEPDLTPHLTDEEPLALSGQLLDRYAQFDDVTALHQAITVLQALIKSMSISAKMYYVAQARLGTALLLRFRRLGELADIEDALSRLRDSIGLMPDNDPGKPDHLNNLGISLQTRFKHLGQLNDLADAISTFRNAVQLSADGHPNKQTILMNLGDCFASRFGRVGQLSDLEDAISILKDALDLTPHDHPDRPRVLHLLGNSLIHRFERLGQLSDLEDAISWHRDAVRLTPDGRFVASARLNSLAISLITRFKRFGRITDLEDAISVFNKVVNLIPNDHPEKSRSLNNLANCLYMRFERLGQLSDLENGILELKEAVELTPSGHPYKAAHLNSLSALVSTRFKCLGQPNDLEEAISLQREAVHLTPHDHPEKPFYLGNLGTSFRIRFQHFGTRPRDIEDAVSTLGDAVALMPDWHPDKVAYLNNLGNSFSTRFRHFGQVSDLDNAISRLKDAVDLIPHDHPGKATSLHNLSGNFNARFRRLGQLSDLEDAIHLQRDALELAPDEYYHKPLFLNRLGELLRSRFISYLGEIGDLQEAISLQRHAVHLTPDGHSDKPDLLDSLAITFLARSGSLGKLSDLEAAISLQRCAVDLIPHGRPKDSAIHNNFTQSLVTRFRHLHQISDLEEAISLQKGVIDLTPDGHIDKPGCLNRLGNYFLIRLEHLNELCDLQDATSAYKSAVELSPHGHPDKYIFLSNLGNSFACRFVFGDSLETSFEHAISLYSHAATSPIGSVDIRFTASQSWISYARRIHHHSLLHAYSVSLSLLPQLAWIGLTLPRRYALLSRGADIAREAAAAALDAGYPQTAVEWLEQGRSVVWRELFQLRGSYDELSSAHPDHARRLCELSVELDQASAIHENVTSKLGVLEQARYVTGSVSEDLLQVANRQRALAIKRDKLLEEIRCLPGFGRFLRHNCFSQLRASAHSGPIVILNAAETRCDALVVLADLDHVIHVPLPKFTFKECSRLQNAMKDFVREARVGARATLPQVSWEFLLSHLWTDVVKVVLDALAYSTPGDLSRIFWCPTGPFTFLPIHAAGLYGTQYLQPGNKVSDFFVSSYIPTLSILSPSSYPCADSNSDLNILAVCQPPTDGLFPLSGVGLELEHIKDTIQKYPAAHTILLESSKGTVEEVLSLMKKADWVHFACHGVQDATNPTHSGLCLADRRRLKLGDMMALQRPHHGGLAFLSACQTAMGDKNLSDEAIHIAAAMLFAGYSGVVGTMWSISDRLAPNVARDVYEQLFRTGRRPDHREAARALHNAVGRLRERNATFVEWIPFIHVGL